MIVCLKFVSIEYLVSELKKIFLINILIFFHRFEDWKKLYGVQIRKK